MAVVGWDIGGVNRRRRSCRGRCGRCGAPTALRAAACARCARADTSELALEIGADAEVAHAVTMTAELPQMFRTKREGVGFVIDAVVVVVPFALRARLCGHWSVPDAGRSAVRASCSSLRRTGRPPRERPLSTIQTRCSSMWARRRATSSPLSVAGLSRPV